MIGLLLTIQIILICALHADCPSVPNWTRVIIELVAGYRSILVYYTDSTFFTKIVIEFRIFNYYSVQLIVHTICILMLWNYKLNHRRSLISLNVKKSLIFALKLRVFYVKSCCSIFEGKILIFLIELHIIELKVLYEYNCLFYSKDNSAIINVFNVDSALFCYKFKLLWLSIKKRRKGKFFHWIIKIVCELVLDIWYFKTI